jgi:hypothetical protein
MIAAPPPDEMPPFVESHVEIGSDRFEYQLTDLDLDGRGDLLVASAAAGERTLRLWRQRADSTFAAAPDWQLAVPPDVVCFALLDVREEPGREILLMTRGGIHSLSTTHEGLKGNLRRERSAPLFPDLADPNRLPFWPLARDLDGDGKEELCVIEEDELVLLAVQAGADGKSALVERGRLPCRVKPADRVRGSISFNGGGSSGFRARGGGQLSSYFPGSRSSQPRPLESKLLERRSTVELPRLLDFAGDAALERVNAHDKAWFVDALPTGGAASAPTKPVRVTLPETAHGSSETDWRDVDGDGRREFVIFRTDSDEDEKVALIHRAAPDPAAPLGALIEETPSARVKLSGMSVEYSLLDVDHDGCLELIARVLDVPTGLATLATVRLDTALHVFRGLPGAKWSRAPDFSWERSFRPEQMGRVQESLLINLGGDFDGDGVNDLVTTQLDGRVEIRRVRKDGDTLALEKSPVVSFAPPAPVSRLETWEFGTDGVADLMLRHEHGLSFFVSRKKGAGK